MSPKPIPSKTITAELSIALGAIRLHYQDDFIRAHIEYTLTLGAFTGSRALDISAAPTTTLAELQSTALQQIQAAEKF